MPMLDAAQRWLCQSATHFDPLTWGGKDAAFVRRKAFAELAVYAHVLGPDTPAPLANLIAERVNDPAYHGLVRRSPRQLLLYSAPLMHVVRQGQATPRTLALIDEAVTRPQVHALERSPHRMMDLWQFLTVVRRCPGWLDPAAILPLSSLAHLPEPFDCTLSEAYAFTHNILFLRNFGAEDPAFDIGIDYPLDRMTIALTVARFLYERNSDIVLEYLLCLGLMDQLNGADMAMILAWVEDHTAGAPFIRGPDMRVEDALVATGLDPDWLAHYHTTLVGAATLVVAERRGWASATAHPPLFDAPLDEVLAWGEVVHRLNRYEIAMAVALTDRIPRGSTFGDAARGAVARYLSTITDAETGHIGHWTDELCAAGDGPAQDDLRETLQEVAALTRSLLPEAALRH